MVELDSVNRWTQHDGTISSRELLRGILMKLTSTILVKVTTRCFLFYLYLEMFEVPFEIIFLVFSME